jgi:hypothetical protein
MHNGIRYRMSVDEFAFARGATASVASKQEAEKAWLPRFTAEISAGRDPRIGPDHVHAVDRPATIADLLKLYRTRYVDIERLKSRSTIVSQLNVLIKELGQLPAKALERPGAIEDFKARYADRALATTNRYLRAFPISATGRSVASCSEQHRSIAEASALSPRTSGDANGVSANRKNNSCWTRASCSMNHLGEWRS